MSPHEIRRDAVFSRVGPRLLRHRLDRWWGNGARILICMANPSSADGDGDDPTIRRLLRLTDRPHLSGFTVVNAWPYVTARPPELRRWLEAMLRRRRREHAAICAANLALIRELSRSAAIRIIAWGKLAPPAELRGETLRAMSLDGAHDLHAFGLTRDGSPIHPMARGTNRLADDAEIMLWMKADRAAKPKE